MFIKMKYNLDKRDPQFNLTTWELGFGDLDPIIGKGITKMVRDLWKEDPPSVYVDTGTVSEEKFIRFEVSDLLHGQGGHEEVWPWTFTLHDVVTALLKLDDDHDGPDERLYALNELKRQVARLEKIVEAEKEDVAQV